MRLTAWVLASALGVVSFAATRTENALLLELNQKGFALVAQEIRQSQLKDVSDVGLDNIDQEVDHGIKVHAEGIRYSLGFDSLSMTPSNGTVVVDLGVRHVNLQVDSMRFSKKLIFTISSTCKNTSLTVGEAGPVHLSAVLTPKVENHRIKLVATAINFGVAENNFKINGPSECSGALGIGSLVKWVVGKVINNSRGRIEETVRNKVAELIPTLESKLNDQVIRQFPLAFKIPGFAEETKITFQTTPYAVDAMGDALGFRLSVDVSNEDAEFNNDRDVLWDTSGVLIGATGLNPALLTEAFAKVFPEGSAFVELTEALVPQMREVLSVKTASALWPDLKEAKLGADYLRAFVRFNGAPEFTLSADEAKVRVTIPNLQIRFMAHLDGEWKDYYLLNLKIATTAILDVVSGNLSLKIAPDSVVSVSGEWAKSYSPKNPAFESELTEFLFSAIFEYLSSQGPLTHIALPVIGLGGEKIGISKLDVKTPFIRAEVSTF